MEAKKKIKITISMLAILLGICVAVSVQTTAAETQNETNIELYSKQPEENVPFQVINMFPGDSETQYFRVKVSYHGTVNVHFKATAQKGYEKLAKALKVRVKLADDGKTLYDGVMVDMPENIACRLSSEKSTADELCYEITAYLDTSTGNEYQNQDLIADFTWWVEEDGGGSGGLDPLPKTGDTSNALLWAVIAAFFGGIILFLLFGRRRRKEQEND